MSVYGLGGVYLPKYKDREKRWHQSRIWWIRYSVPGRGQVRETSHSKNKNVAIHLLKDRVGDVGHGTLIAPDVAKTTVGQLKILIEQDYQKNARRSIGSLKYRLQTLCRSFPDDVQAAYVTTTRVEAYIAERLKQGAKPSTINRELAALKRMFRLGRRQGLVAVVPFISLLVEHNVRTGFFEHEEMLALRKELPEFLRPVVDVAYLTGWRVRSEILTRQWRHVDFRGGTLRLEPGEAKNREGREFRLLKPLREVLEHQCGIVPKDCPWVFPQPNGHPIHRKLWQDAWTHARKVSGIDRIAHDFRRTAVRNLEKAGVPRAVAMKMVGHKTEAVYLRYAITDERMIQGAARQYEKYMRKVITPSEKQ